MGPPSGSLLMSPCSWSSAIGLKGTDICCNHVQGVSTDQSSINSRILKQCIFRWYEKNTRNSPRSVKLHKNFGEKFVKFSLISVNCYPNSYTSSQNLVTKPLSSASESKLIFYHHYRRPPHSPYTWSSKKVPWWNSSAVASVARRTPELEIDRAHKKVCPRAKAISFYNAKWETA